MLPTLVKLSIPSLKFHTGNSIPIVGLGTYQMNDKECESAVYQAVVAGYRHIDTASLYENEKGISKALDKLYSEKLVTREDLFITSKIAPWEQGYDQTIKACDKILKGLKTTYLDLLIIHWPGVKNVEPNSKDNSTIRVKTWEALVELQKKGKVRDIGVSNFLVHHLEDLMKNSSVVPVLNQFEIHPLLYPKDTIEFCKKNNIVVEAYSSLARNDKDLMKNKTVVSIAEKHKKTSAQVALRWAIQQEFVILPKSVREERMKENIDIFDFELTSEEISTLTGLNKNKHTCWDPNRIKY